MIRIWVKWYICIVVVKVGGWIQSGMKCFYGLEVFIEDVILVLEISVMGVWYFMDV